MKQEEGKLSVGTHLLVIYDRVPHGWNVIPADSKETNNVWVVRITMEAARSKE